MLKVITQADFDTLYCNSWGQAVSVLKEIKDYGKEDELMDYLEACFPDGADAIELNDLLSYDWDWVYSQIGMPLDATEHLADEENEDVE